MDVQDVSQHSVETDSSIHLRMEAQNNAMTEMTTIMIFVSKAVELMSVVMDSSALMKDVMMEILSMMMDVVLLVHQNNVAMALYKVVSNVMTKIATIMMHAQINACLMSVEME
jgi:hypothetical protein